MSYSDHEEHTHPKYVTSETTQITDLLSPAAKGVLEKLYAGSDPKRLLYVNTVISDAVSKGARNESGSNLYGNLVQVMESVIGFYAGYVENSIVTGAQFHMYGNSILDSYNDMKNTEAAQEDDEAEIKEPPIAILGESDIAKFIRVGKFMFISLYNSVPETDDDSLEHVKLRKKHFDKLFLDGNNGREIADQNRIMEISILEGGAIPSAHKDALTQLHIDTFAAITEGKIIASTTVLSLQDGVNNEILQRIQNRIRLINRTSSGNIPGNVAPTLKDLEYLYGPLLPELFASEEAIKMWQDVANFAKSHREDTNNK